jgi:hypothetical protein
MSYIGWLGGRLLLAAVMAGVATFAGGALGGLLFGFQCRALTSNDTGKLPPLAATICESFLGFGTACLGTGVAVGLVMATTGWRRSASDPKSPSAYQWPDDGRRARTAGAPPAPVTWLLVPAFLLIVTLLSTWLAASQAIHFVALHFATLSHGLDGLLLMPPGFTLGTAGTLLLGELGLLLLLSARSPLFPPTYVLLAVAHLGLIVCNRSLLGAIRSISEPAGSELPILQTVESVVAAAVPGLIWSLVAHAGALPFLMLAGVRALFSPRHPPARISPRPPTAPAPSVEPVTSASVPLQAMWPRPALGAEPGLGTKYFLRATFLAWPFAGRIRINGLEDASTLTASLTPLRPRPTIQVWLETPRGRVHIVTMESRHLLGFGNKFDIRDGARQEPLAVVKKLFAANWLVYGPTGDLAAVVTKERSGLGTAAFVARIGERPVASFAWSNAMRPALEADFSADAERLIDRRLGVALGVLLFVNLSFGR